MVTKSAYVCCSDRPVNQALFRLSAAVVSTLLAGSCLSFGIGDDEVLAVGDVGFQNKCIGKMNGISKVEGRTVLFVSHNMSMIQHLCKRAILLKNGRSLTTTCNKRLFHNIPEF